MSNRDTSFTTFLLQRRNRLQAGFYNQHPTYPIPSQEVMLQVRSGSLPIYTQCAGSSSTTPACNCDTVAETPPTVCTTSSIGSLDLLATYLRNYMTEFRNANFWAYRCDGDVEGTYIEDGGYDMFDGGNFVTPWLLSETLYNLSSTDLNDYPEHISYSTTTETTVDTDFKYISLGWIYQEDSEDGQPQYDTSRLPLTVLGYRCVGPVGWQIGGDVGADGNGTTISGYIYSNATINGFQVYAGYRQVYNAGDSTICSLIILLGHPHGIQYLARFPFNQTILIQHIVHSICILEQDLKIF